MVRLNLENRTVFFWDYLAALIIISGTQAVEVRCLLESRPSSADALAEGAGGSAPFGGLGNPGLWPEGW